MKKVLSMVVIMMAAVAILFGVSVNLASEASAQNRNCASRDKVVARLSEGYGESRVSIGLGANNQVVETFANLDSGTWTVTVTTPNGVTCLVASGKAFELVKEVLSPGEKDA